MENVLASRPDHAEANYELGKELLLEGRPEKRFGYRAAVRLKRVSSRRPKLQSAYRAEGRKEMREREGDVYRALKAKSWRLSLPPPRQAASSTIFHRD